MPRPGGGRRGRARRQRHAGAHQKPPQGAPARLHRVLPYTALPECAAAVIMPTQGALITPLRQLYLVALWPAYMSEAGGFCWADGDKVKLSMQKGSRVTHLVKNHRRRPLRRRPRRRRRRRPRVRRTKRRAAPTRMWTPLQTTRRSPPLSSPS